MVGPKSMSTCCRNCKKSDQVGISFCLTWINAFMNAACTIFIPFKDPEVYNHPTNGLLFHSLIFCIPIFSLIPIQLLDCCTTCCCQAESWCSINCCSGLQITYLDIKDEFGSQENIELQNIEDVELQNIKDLELQNNEDLQLRNIEDLELEVGKALEDQETQRCLADQSSKKTP